MKRISIRHRRKSKPAKTEGAFFKKESQESFFGSGEHETFFHPAVTAARAQNIQRQPEKKEEERVQRAEDKKEEEKVMKKEDKKEEIVMRTEEKKEEENIQRQPEKKEEEKKVQRVEDKKEEEKIIKKGDKRDEEKVMKMEDKKEEEKVQKQEAGKSAVPGKSVSNYISSLNGKGQPLPAQANNFFSSRMGYDFSGVKVHTDKEAVESAKAVNARAYSVGKNIVFNEGQYDTRSGEGKKLMAHELAHVVQQGEGKKLFRKPADTPPADTVFETLRTHLKNADLASTKQLITSLSPDQKNYLLSSAEFMRLAARGGSDGADFGDESITQLMEAFTEGGYQNLSGCLRWMFYEFDEDDANAERLLRIINRHSETQKAIARSYFKENFFGILGGKGVAEIIKALGGSLNEKLGWLKDKGIESWSLVRDTIIHHLSRHRISRDESNNIYNGLLGDMRWYFGRKIDVGDSEMVRVVSLFEFALYQKLDWMLYEDTNLALAFHVIGASAPAESMEVMAMPDLMQKLKDYFGENDFDRINGVLNKAVEADTEMTSSIEPGKPATETVIQDELTSDDGVDEDAKKLFDAGFFLLEMAMDEIEILKDSKIAAGSWQHLLPSLEFMAVLLKMFLKYPGDTSKEREINQMAQSGQGNEIKIHAVRFGRLPSVSRPVGVSRIMPPPPPMIEPLPPLPATLPASSGSFSAVSGGMQPWYTPLINNPLTRPEFVTPLIPYPDMSPDSGGWSKYEWKEKMQKPIEGLRRAVDLLRDLRRQIENLPQPDTQPDTQQEQDKQHTQCVPPQIYLPAAPTGFSKNDPIEIVWYKPLNRYENPIQIQGIDYFMQTTGQSLPAPNEDIKIGVDNDYLPAIGKILMLFHQQDRSEQGKFRRRLLAAGYPWINANDDPVSPDHIQDLMWNGPDEYENLWPLESGYNSMAGLIQNMYQGILFRPNRDSPCAVYLSIEIARIMYQMSNRYYKIRSIEAM